ncbi:type III PLP-dependent enzyme [Sneathiella chinensis]|uniref:ornithine decarboxylase n=1 Tax=Sneathiella chinensis TaxID=349750 RepID=A0ABQ5U647_9PROT|nr:type III PLP-dependent enzyme [Sneathiella chinensis]GLQ05966.1 ornithine decarboxylase [Sneathiella chinensis]
MQLVNSVKAQDVAVQRALEDVPHYVNECEALIAENCNDSVHFLYADKIREKASLFLNNFRGSSLYAIKANPHPAIMNLLWHYGVRKFEMASLREIEYVVNMFPEAELYFMHPVKSRQAIRGAYALGVRTFAFDCLDELRKIEEETDHASDLSLFLRVRVDQVNAAYPLSDKFGVPVQEAPLLIQRAQQNAQKVGLTFHVGSQCMDPAAYSEALSQIANMLSSSGVSIDKLDIGGGFPVYYPGMEPGLLEGYFDTIHRALDEHGLDTLELYCEPGRALVAEAGAVAVRVEMRKGQALYMNDGTYGALFDAGVPGWTYPLELRKMDGAEVSDGALPFRLYGPTCDSCDKMEGPFELPDNIAEGDWVIFRHLGAYGYAMQTRFNGFYSETMVAIG